MKLFFFDHVYVLVHLDDTMIDRSNLFSYFSFIRGCLMYFILIHLPHETWYYYCALNCIIISNMFKELNSNISKSFKINISDIRRIQLTHNKISRLSSELSKRLSVPLFVIYYHFFKNICRFAFHITCFLRDPQNSGLCSCII